MILLPRIAVGTVQPDADHRVMAAALMQVLTDHGLRVQPFYARGCFTSSDMAQAITHLRRRYLDSWLMHHDVCVELFETGSQFADIALVEGCFDSTCCQCVAGGSLDRLADYLDLPKLAIVDACRMPTGCVPAVPAQTAGILLDNVANTAQFCHLQTVLESLFDVPVLGSLGQLAGLRTLLTHASSADSSTGELCAALGREFQSRVQLDRILQLASSRPRPVRCQGTFATTNRRRRNLHVAVALDEAFTCYFPDTLDVLEQRGATVSVFSPLSSDQLPTDCDVLYFGCGRPEQFAKRLADNICMKEAIWNHVLAGGRVYAESAGMAYLAREMELANGRSWPMVGVVPAVAQFNPHARLPEPTIVRIDADCWLFSRGQEARGYLNHRWHLRDNHELLTLAATSKHHRDLVGNYQVVASRLNLHFASQPALLQHFFQPVRWPRVNVAN